MIEDAVIDEKLLNRLTEQIAPKTSLVLTDFIISFLRHRKITNTPIWNLEKSRENPGDTDQPLFIELNKLPPVGDLNQYFIKVNQVLSERGLFVLCLHKKEKGGKKNLVEAKPTHAGELKLPDGKFNKVYHDRNQHYSLAEILGRLVYCGFEIMDFRQDGHITCIIASKSGNPRTEPYPSKGLIIKMKRIGKNGRFFNIYKVRTMYRFSEYIQDYLVDRYGYDEFGKPNNDFRMLPYGKFLRKFYIDEIPQLVNLVKRDIDLVGVRRLSRSGLNYLPPEIREERMKYKPGLIPPQIAIGQNDIKGVIFAERTYLDELKTNPIKTNFKYFFKALYNILSLKTLGK